jgi:DNA repair ATPase RecN
MHPDDIDAIVDSVVRELHPPTTSVKHQTLSTHHAIGSDLSPKQILMNLNNHLNTRGTKAITAAENQAWQNNLAIVLDDLNEFKDKFDTVRERYRDMRDLIENGTRMEMKNLEKKPEKQIKNLEQWGKKLTQALHDIDDINRDVSLLKNILC